MAIRVMHLLSSASYSGAEHVALDLIRMLSTGVESVYVSPAGAIDAILKKRGILHIALPSMSYGAVLRAMLDFCPNIIHAHDYRASCIAALLPFRGKIISHIHNNNVWATKINLRTLLYTGLMWRYFKIVVVSQPVIDEFVFRGIFKKKAVVIKNVIDEADIFGRSREIPYSEELRCDFLFLGRLSKEKDPSRFLRLIAEAKKEKKDIKAVMVGDGPMKESLLKYIHQMALESNVHMKGFQENPYPYIRYARALLMTSSWEGFGLAALEAMLLGCPVLATPVGGLQKLVGSYDAGALCHTDEDFLSRMLSPERTDKEKLISYARSVNDIDSFIHKWREIYC